MIEEILPGIVATAEAFRDAGDDPEYPEEAERIRRAIPKRRAEFLTGRSCARRALAAIGVPAGPIPARQNGAPLWPAGVVGTITHCEGYRAAAVARATDLASLGVDAEPHAPLPDGVLRVIALPEEREWLGELAARSPGPHWDRLLFCAKEAVYKAWFPLTERWLGFEQACVTVERDGGAASGHEGSAGRGRFSARLITPTQALDGRVVTGFDGRWLIHGGLILTSVTVDPLGPPPTELDGGPGAEVTARRGHRPDR